MGTFINLQLKALRQEIEIRMKNSVKHGQTVSREVPHLHVYLYIIWKKYTNRLP